MQIRHGRINLTLHEFASRPGPALLLLHSLYGSSREWGEGISHWPGSVYALDFSGHGESEWSVGGAYLAELLAADADAALAQIGPTAVAGAGLGAYIALLISGGRPDLVPATLLLPGAGLDGGGAEPNFRRPFSLDLLELAVTGCDPLVQMLERDVRPIDYAHTFAGAARQLLLAEDGSSRPLWWEAAAAAPNARRVTAALPAALAALAAAGTKGRG